MKFKTISITRGFKVQMAKYEMANVEISTEIELEPGDDETDAYQALYDFVDERLMEELEKLDA